MGSAREAGVDLVVVGPEAPLVAGLADRLAEAGIACFGPGAAGAALEGSKAFCKEVMEAAGVPTAAYRVVTDPAAGMAAIERYPAVIKADGLAAGKGVIIATDETQAREALEAAARAATVRYRARGRRGAPRGQRGVAAGRMRRRASRVPLASAQDYKRIFDGDQGPNTGGMGSYSPVPAIDTARAREICASVHQPVLDELRAARDSVLRACSTPA